MNKQIKHEAERLIQAITRDTMEKNSKYYDEQILILNIKMQEIQSLERRYKTSTQYSEIIEREINRLTNIYINSTTAPTRHPNCRHEIHQQIKKKCNWCNKIIEGLEEEGADKGVYYHRECYRKASMEGADSQYR